jgi:hypothetical protein
VPEKNPYIAPVFIRHFAPESWTELERFLQFWGTAYTFKVAVSKRLGAIYGHRDRVQCLFEFAQRIAPTLAEDEAEMQSQGFTGAVRAKELAAIVDATFKELFSILDCFKSFFFAVCPNHAGVKNSTTGLFANGYAGTLDARIPQPIRDAFRQTKLWYDQLRLYRDEVTHADVGWCHRDRETKTVQYMHRGLGTPTRAALDADIFATLARFIEGIDAFLQAVFHELNKNLKPVETQQLCGTYLGRVYMRNVTPQEAVDFNGGRCESLVWFDQEGQNRCPLADKCGAYARAKQDAAKSE